MSECCESAGEVSVLTMLVDNDRSDISSLQRSLSGWHKYRLVWLVMCVLFDIRQDYIFASFCPDFEGTIFSSGYSRIEFTHFTGVKLNIYIPTVK